MPEQERNTVHLDVSLDFELVTRMLYGQPVDCEKCGAKYATDDDDQDTVQAYQYPQTGTRVLLCDDCAIGRGFCPGCGKRFALTEIWGHMKHCEEIEHGGAEE